MKNLILWKDAKQCDQEEPNDSIDDSIKSDNLTM
jgi:hypothetical protein